MINPPKTPLFRKTGIGLRHPHHTDILEKKPGVGFLEVHPENYFVAGGPALHYLEKAREIYPISFHGVGMSLGSADGLNTQHLQHLKDLVSRFEPFQISDHVSWSRVPNAHVPDLLPVPMTEEALDVLSRNVETAQKALDRALWVENPSSYLSFKNNEMDEPIFLKKLVERTGCGLLLDVNNIYVSSHNIGFDTAAYLAEIPKGAVQEIHLAGYTENEVNQDFTMYIDTHGAPVHGPVWALYEQTLEVLGDVNTLLEWDTDIPSLEILVQEAEKADVLRQKAAEKRQQKAEKSPEEGKKVA